MAKSMTYEERRWTSHDGLSLFARDYPAAGGGDHLPVICLHGLTRNSKDFEDAAPLIAVRGRRVIVPDVRGRGLSGRDPIPSNYHPKTYARDVLSLMDGLGIPRAIFIGTSMGGIITMTLAAIRSKAVGRGDPQRCRARRCARRHRPHPGLHRQGSRRSELG